MVAPSLTLADSCLKDGNARSSDNISLETAPEKDQDAICFVTPALIDSSSKGGKHGINYCNGDTKGSTNCIHGTRLIKEPQGNVEECGIHVIRESKEPNSNGGKCGPQENDAMQQERTTEITSRVHDMDTTQQPTKLIDSTAYATINADCAPKGKRVQWNDNHGKELVHVFEYGLSDAGETEEDEDDTDTCACTIQ